MPNDAIWKMIPSEVIEQGLSKTLEHDPEASVTLVYDILYQLIYVR